ncbi:pyruvate kinase [Anaeromyxobacter sp. PSR-1]|uniref:pyruvate kinase n=1 Tax=unclassified Anaeromyxobacter TaxID=2620896 RepID=UPI0005DD3902|nr:pyruvate kinase [Anaeromyxobacter sp. PSR-1]GAO02957.1 pyruvate kinase [Anaeromyxobacter sp. PSR-1]
MRRAKIVATLGPASGEPDVLARLLEQGVDVARLNFSHGRHEDHARMLDKIRAASRHLGKAVAVLQDLQGPKIRTGPLKAGKAGVQVEAGQELVITTEGELPGDAHLVSTTYPHLAEDVRAGDRLLVDDGLLEFRVLATDGVRVRTEVVEGGWLGEHKGINLPGVALRAEALSEKDRADVAFGISHGVDYVALSFVRTPEDIALCRDEMERAGRVVPIIAKIEKPEAIDNLDAIIAAADGVMVARGDLGVEILPERVPLLQKEICSKANASGKPVIIATQMLNSMIEHPRPTRAEASDVANGIWDGADAVMLSGETASGRFPLAAVQMMDRIVREAEAGTPAALHARIPPPARPAPFNLVTAAAACEAAEAAGAVAICCFTLRGETARLLAHFRPRVPIVAFSPDQSIRRRLALYWGVLPKVMEPVKNADLMAEIVSDRLLEERLVKPGDRVALVHGSPLGLPGQTNSIRLHEITHPSDRGPAQRYRVPV